MSILHPASAPLPMPTQSARYAPLDAAVHTLLLLPTHRHTPHVNALQAAATDAAYQEAWAQLLAANEVLVLRHVQGQYSVPQVHTAPGYAQAPARYVQQAQLLTVAAEHIAHRALCVQLTQRPLHYHAWWCSATHCWAATAPAVCSLQLAMPAEGLVQVQLQVHWQHPQPPMPFSIPNLLRHVVAL